MFYKSSFNEDYERGLDMLYASSKIFGSLANSIGTPVANEEIPTARVAFNTDTKKISFEVNPDFINPLTDDQIAAVIAHETYHVLLDHLSELSEPEYTDRSALIDAHECIINDALESNVGVRLPEDIGIRYGTELYNQDFSYFTTKQGYDFIVKNKDNKEESPENNEGSSEDNAREDDDSKGFFNCGGVYVPEEFADDFREAIKVSIKDTVDEVDEDQIDDDLKDVLDEFVSMSYSVNDNSSGFVKATIESGMNMNWFKILSRINPKINTSGKKRTETTWMKPPRRLLSVYPEVIIPEVVHERKDPRGAGDSLPTIIVALDLSYSIPRNLVQKLVNLVDEVPEAFFKPIPVTWSDYVLPYDNKSKRVVPSNGTNINAVYEYAQKITKEKGSAPYVFVISDGQCSFSHYSRIKIDKDYLNNQWYWCAIKDNDVHNITKYFVNSGHADKSKVYKLSDFT